MKRLFLWLLMVVLFTGAIVGGSLAFLYYHITEEDLPEKAITLAGQTLDEPVGYQWTLPILGGMVWRELDLSPGSAIQTLDEPITTASAELVLAEGMTESATTLLLGLSCGALYLIRKDYPAPKPSKLDGVVNAVLIVFALVYGLLGVWGVIQLFA